MANAPLGEFVLPESQCISIFNITSLLPNLLASHLLFLILVLLHGAPFQIVVRWFGEGD
jgi:hypothetical protein